MIMPVIPVTKQDSFPVWSEINHYGINHLKVGQEVPLHYQTNIGSSSAGEEFVRQKETHTRSGLATWC